MAVIPYTTSTLHGSEISGIIADLITLKARVAAMMNLVNEASGGGATPANLEGGDFGMPTGSGSAFYSEFHDSIYLPVSGISDTALADLNRGGAFS